MPPAIRRVTIVVLDSVGIGALPDAERYGDAGSDTLGHLAAAVGGLHLPHLARFGLGNIAPLAGVAPSPQPLAAFGRMAEKSAGKDTTTGHWEMCGIVLDKPFPTYPDGFPPEVIEPFCRAIGRRVLGNKVASGTEIIVELGAEHVRTGWPIVYTSADSVFQIAAHEEIIPLPELYRICQAARHILQGEHAVGRVIARPFTGAPGQFRRTANRHDFSLPPPGATLLDLVAAAGKDVWAVGKISDVFAGRSVARSQPTRDNMEGIDCTLAFLRQPREGGPALIFANLVDFDMLWGHRNDPAGYAQGLAAFDARLPELAAAVGEDDMFIITADHGCDPTTPGTDHTREYVPLLVYSPGGQAGVDLGTRSTFADLGATVAEALGVANPGPGRSFLAACR